MPGYLRRIPTWGRYLACLLFAALLFAAWPAQADGQTPSQPLNASGNRNIPLSVDPIDQGEGYSAILYDNRNGLPTSEANAIAQTNDEGNLWFTSTRQCVMKIVPNRFLDLFGQYGIPSDIVNSTCMLNGRLFIGTDESGLMVVENGKLLDALPLTEARTASGETIQADDLLLYLRGERVRSVIRDKQDRLWISTWRHNHGLICYDHGIMTAFTQADGLQSNEVRTVSECEDGSILVAQLDGVSLIRDMRVVDGWGAQDGLVVTSILTLTEGFNGELLFGSDGGGIYAVGPDGCQKKAFLPCGCSPASV